MKATRRYSFPWSSYLTVTSRAISVLSRFSKLKRAGSLPNFCSVSHSCMSMGLPIEISSRRYGSPQRVPPRDRSRLSLICPQNIMVTTPGPNWSVKIADFGISKCVQETALQTIGIGSVGYLAPEVLGVHSMAETGLSESGTYTVKVDMWALGEICHRMMTNRPVFDGWPHLFRYVTIDALFPTRSLEEALASLNCRDFIKEAMVAAPRARLSSTDGLNHPWIRSQGLPLGFAQQTKQPQWYASCKIPKAS